MGIDGEVVDVETEGVVDTAGEDFTSGAGTVGRGAGTSGTTPTSEDGSFTTVSRGAKVTGG